MMKINKKLSLFVFTTMLVGLASCGPDTSIVFSKEKLGLLMGDFYAGNQVLSIGTSGATLTSGDEVIKLNNVKVEGEGFDTKVTYSTKDGQVTVSWTDDDVKKLSFEINETVIEFQPSLESVKGWYTGFGNVDEDNVNYITTNDFDGVNNLFVGSIIIGGECVYSGYRIETGYVIVEEEAELYYGFYFLDDLENVFDEYFVDKDEETGKIDLRYLYYPEDFAFESAAMHFAYTYFDSDVPELYSGLSFWGLDEWEKTVYVGQDMDPSVYTEGFDEHGQYILVKDMKLRGTSYGITVETSSGVKEMPLDTSELFFEIQDVTYFDGENSILLTTDYSTWELYTEINGERCDSFELVVHNHQMKAKASKGENVYYFSYYADGVVEVEINDSQILYLDVDKFSTLFVKDYLDETGEVLNINENLVITYSDETSAQGSLKYTDEYGIVFLAVNGDMVVSLNEESGIYFLVQDETVSYLFDKYVIELYQFNPLTDGKLSLWITDQAVKIQDVEYEIIGYTMITIGFSYVPAIVVDNGMLKMILSLSASYVGLFSEPDAQGSLTLISTFVPERAFELAVGEYKYDGPNGVETVSLTEDGTLTVDTKKEGSETEFEPVVYDYLAQINEDDQLVLVFTFKDSQVPVTFHLDGHVDIFGEIVYLEQTYFYNQGIFTDGETIVTIFDNVVKVNGSELEVTACGSNVIDGIIGENDVRLTMNPDQNNLQYEVNSGTPVTLTKSTVSLADFEGEYVDVSGTKNDVIVQNGKLYWRSTGSGFPPIPMGVEPDFVLIDGEIAVTFEYSGYKYTMQKIEGVVQVTAESTAPPAPPIL